MKQTELNLILDQHKLWIDGKGGKCANLGGADLYRANLEGADLRGADLRRASLHSANLTDADLYRANLQGADLTGANLMGANLLRAVLTNAILPDIAWIKAGCLVQLNEVKCGFYLSKESKWENFTQDSFGFIIQNNGEENSFDMLIEDRIIRNIPDWVKLSGLKQIESV